MQGEAGRMKNTMDLGLSFDTKINNHLAYAVPHDVRTLCEKRCEENRLTQDINQPAFVTALSRTLSPLRHLPRNTAILYLLAFFGCAGYLLLLYLQL